MALRTNPSAARKLVLALASGRRQVGSNGDGNVSGPNATEGQGDTQLPVTTPAATGRNGKPTYPPGHLAGMPVPKGGSMCANCKFLGTDMKSCTEPNFIGWDGPNKPSGSSTIPGPIDSYCSDWYMSKVMTPGLGFGSISRPGSLAGTQSGSQPAGAGSNAPLQAPATGGNAPGAVG